MTWEEKLIYLLLHPFAKFLHFQETRSQTFEHKECKSFYEQMLSLPGNEKVLK